MSTTPANATTNTCKHCLCALPHGIRVAFFETEDSPSAVLGDFCCVSHAIAAFDEAVEAENLPASMFLGVHVDRGGHDVRALGKIMLEVAQQMVAGDGTIDLPQRKPRPSNSLN